MRGWSGGGTTPPAWIRKRTPCFTETSLLLAESNSFALFTPPHGKTAAAQSVVVFHFVEHEISWRESFTSDQQKTGLIIQRNISTTTEDIKEIL